jgi:hypothetical protein
VKRHRWTHVDGQIPREETPDRCACGALRWYEPRQSRQKRTYWSDTVEDEIFVGPDGTGVRLVNPSPVPGCTR